MFRIFSLEVNRDVLFMLDDFLNGSEIGKRLHRSLDYQPSIADALSGPVEKYGLCLLSSLSAVVIFIK
jgi:hypothetical protein